MAEGSRRQRDQYRVFLRDHLNSLVGDAVEKAQRGDVRYSITKYQALLDYIEFELFDVLCPKFTDSDYVCPDGADPVEYAKWVEHEKYEAGVKAREYEKAFEGFSRMRLTGILDEPRRVLSFIAILTELASLTEKGARWLTTPGEGDAEVIPALDGDRPPV